MHTEKKETSNVLVVERWDDKLRALVYKSFEKKRQRKKVEIKCQSQVLIPFLFVTNANAIGYKTLRARERIILNCLCDLA